MRHLNKQRQAKLWGGLPVRSGASAATNRGRMTQIAAEDNAEQAARKGLSDDQFTSSWGEVTGENERVLAGISVWL